MPWLAAVVAESDRRSFLFRFVGGGVLVAAGIIGIVAVYAGTGTLASVLNGVVFALVGLVGVGVVVAPLLWRMFNQLRTEREGRIREQERAEVAAMIHDQVLHTLALIQRNSADIKEVQRLARGQERTPAQLALQAGRLADRAVRRRRWSRPRPRSRTRTRSASRPWWSATPSATTGWRRWSPPPGRRWSTRPGTPEWTTVSLYAEVEADELSVFVRDRGAGFDVDQRRGVPARCPRVDHRPDEAPRRPRGDPQHPGRGHRGPTDHAGVA